MLAGAYVDDDAADVVSVLHGSVVDRRIGEGDLVAQWDIHACLQGHLGTAIQVPAGNRATRLQVDYRHPDRVFLMMDKEADHRSLPIATARDAGRTAVGVDEINVLFAVFLHNSAPPVDPAYDGSRYRAGDVPVNWQL